MGQSPVGDRTPSWACRQCMCWSRPAPSSTCTAGVKRDFQQQAMQRMKRKECNVLEKWSMTWMKFVVWYDMRQIRGVLDLALLASALRTAPQVDTVCTWMYSTVTHLRRLISPLTSMYGDVRCRKARSCCVRRRILHARTSPYGHMRQCTAP